jgi:hypothetical protein
VEAVIVLVVVVLVVCIRTLLLDLILFGCNNERISQDKGGSLKDIGTPI